MSDKTLSYDSVLTLVRSLFPISKVEVLKQGELPPEYNMKDAGVEVPACEMISAFGDNALVDVERQITDLCTEIQRQTANFVYVSIDVGTLPTPHLQMRMYLSNRLPNSTTH